MEYNRRKQEIEIESIDRLIAIYGEESDEAKLLYKKKEELLLKYEKFQRDNEKDILQNTRSNAIQLQMAYEDSNSDMYHNSEALQEALFQNEMESMFARRDLYKRNSEEWLNIDAEITERDEEHCLELRQHHADLLAHYREQWIGRDVAEEQRIAMMGLEYLHF